MKNRLKLSNLYDDLYNRAVEFNKKYNPCKVTNGVCAAGRFCCSGCKYLGDSGCTVKALGCKLWFCNSALAPKEGAKELRAIIDEGHKHKFLVYRGSKKDSLDCAMGVYIEHLQIFDNLHGFRVKN